MCSTTSRKSQLSHAVVHSLLMTILLFGLSLQLAAQSTRPTGRSTINGRAVYDDTGRPVRRALVILSPDGKAGEPREAVTDGRGEFVLKNVVEGDYQLLVDFPGTINGMQRDLRNHKTTAVSVDGVSSASLTVRVQRWGAITGKVTYPDGEPAVAAQVNVYTKLGNGISHVAFVSSGAATDDRGVYRIYPLLPGEYIVSVIEQSLLLVDLDGVQTQTVANKSLTPYYYSDASTYKDAAVVRVEPGQEVHGIDIQLTDRQTHTISGLVTASGRPFAGAYLRLNPQDEGPSGPTLTRPYGVSVRADQEGRWQFSDIPDGTFEISLDPLTERDFGKPDGSGALQPKYVWRPQTVKVAGADISNVVLSLSKGGRISGTVVVEGDKSLPETMVSLEVAGDSGQQPFSTFDLVESESEGAFTLGDVLAGEAAVSARVMYRPNYYVKSITWKGRDLLRQSLPVAEDGEIDGLQIVLSTEVAVLKCTVISADGKKRLINKTVLLIPSDESRWARHDAVIPVHTGISGEFTVGVAPGEYLLLVPGSEMGDFPSADYLRSNAAQTQRLSLKPGEENSVEISVPEQ